MAKTTTCVTIDPELKNVIRKLGGSVSQILNNSLRAYIEQVEDEKPRVEIEKQIEEITQKQKELAEKKANLFNRLDNIINKQEKQEEQDLDDKLKMASAIKNTDIIRRG